MIDDYLGEVIQDSDKLLRTIEGELRIRKISKAYLDVKIEEQVKKKNINVSNTSL